MCRIRHSCIITAVSCVYTPSLARGDMQRSPPDLWPASVCFDKTSAAPCCEGTCKPLYGSWLALPNYVQQATQPPAWYAISYNHPIDD